LTNANGADIYLAKLNSTGTQQFAKQFGPASRRKGNQGLAVGPRRGDRRPRLDGRDRRRRRLRVRPLDAVLVHPGRLHREVHVGRGLQVVHRYEETFDDLGTGIKTEYVGNVYATGYFATRSTSGWGDDGTRRE